MAALEAAAAETEQGVAFSAAFRLQAHERMEGLTAALQAMQNELASLADAGRSTRRELESLSKEGQFTDPSSSAVVNQC